MDVYSGQSDVADGRSKVTINLDSFNKILARVEMYISAALLSLILILLLINVFTRMINSPIYWVDEAAILAMVWMALFAASAGIQKKSSIAVTIVSSLLSGRTYHSLMALVDMIMLIFFIVLTVLCWYWFDPMGLYMTSWNLSEFSLSTLNFIYEEPTMTLGVKKFWFWLILPFFSILSLIHSAINLYLSVLNVLKGGS